MKRLKKCALMSLSMLTMASCSPEILVDAKDYIKTIDVVNDDFRILQLTDIHWNHLTDLKKTDDNSSRVIYDYFRELIYVSNPDLIMVTGDTFLEANKYVVNQFFSLMEDCKVPYAMLWGNHDKEGTYSKNWLFDQAKKGKRSLFVNPNDNVYGDCNYVINLNRDGSTFYQIYAIDTNSNYYSKEDGYKYDNIHEDQIKWYISQAELAKESNQNKYVPSIAYFHIPLWEWVYSFKENNYSLNGTVTGDIFEEALYEVPGLTDDCGEIALWPGYKDSDFFDESRKRGMQAMFCGHDHNNDSVSRYKDVTIGYGVKSGRGLYYYGKKDGYDYDVTGGSLITIHIDQSYTLEQIFIDQDNKHTNYYKENELPEDFNYNTYVESNGFTFKENNKDWFRTSGEFTFDVRESEESL